MENNIILDPNKFKKSNILIDIRKSEIFKVWNEYEHKLLNSLLYIYSQKSQNEVENPEFFIKEHTILIKDLKELMDLSSNKSYKTIIIDSLEKLRDFGFNARYNGKVYYTSFIYEFNKEELLELGKSNRNQKILIKFNKHLFDCILQKKNFTILDIEINKLHSKYAMNIYQIIKMKQKQINPKTQEKLTSIKYNLKELNEIFMTNHKYISLFKKHFNKAKKSIILKKLIKEEDFNFEFNKDNIVIKFKNLNNKDF